MGHVVVAGRVTQDSIVARLGRALPGRTTVVVTRRTEPPEPPADVHYAHSVDEALALAARLEAARRDEVSSSAAPRSTGEALPRIGTRVPDPGARHRAGRHAPCRPGGSTAFGEPVERDRARRVRLRDIRAPLTVSLYYLGNARTDEQARQMRELEADGVCLFCPPNLATGPARGPPHARTGRVTPNEFPYRGTRLHLLLVPDEHVTDLVDLSPRGAAGLLGGAGAGPGDEHGLTYYGLAIRNGASEFTGGTIRHVHVHLLQGDRRGPGAPRRCAGQAELTPGASTQISSTPAARSTASPSSIAYGPAKKQRAEPGLGDQPRAAGAGERRDVEVGAGQRRPARAARATSSGLGVDRGGQFDVDAATEVVAGVAVEVGRVLGGPVLVVGRVEDCAVAHGQRADLPPPVGAAPGLVGGGQRRAGGTARRRRPCRRSRPGAGPGSTPGPTAGTSARPAPRARRRAHSAATSDRMSSSSGTTSVAAGHGTRQILALHDPYRGRSGPAAAGRPPPWPEPAPGSPCAARGTRRRSDGPSSSTSAASACRSNSAS